MFGKERSEIDVQVQERVQERVRMQMQVQVQVQVGAYDAYNYGFMSKSSVESTSRK